MNLLTILEAAKKSFIDYKSRTENPKSIERLNSYIEFIDGYKNPSVESILSKLEECEKDLIIAKEKLKTLIRQNLDTTSNLDIRGKEQIKAESYALYMSFAEIQMESYSLKEKLDVVIDKQIIKSKVDEIASTYNISATAAKSQFVQTEEYRALSDHLIYAEIIYKTADLHIKIIDQFVRGAVQSVSILNKEVTSR